MGNALGAGKAALARLAALAAGVSFPFLWVVVAVVLVTPACQRALLGLFSSGADELLLQRMRRLLMLVVVLELFDGGQTGVGAGRPDGQQQQQAGTTAAAVLGMPALAPCCACWTMHV